FSGMLYSHLTVKTGRENKGCTIAPGAGQEIVGPGFSYIFARSVGCSPKETGVCKQGVSFTYQV
ncbi:MAG: hypothetical protein RBU26_12095, partial [Sphaerochaeta sp.]|uniref:hypothetical protein n=1 Tax=Sphaerochaeta sp. TaxID=1972642 RepID=UPI002A35E82A